MREVERKVAVPAGFVLPPLVGSATGVASQRALAPVELLAEYHDTEDRRLARAGVSLRRRQGGADAGWHLKLPAPGGEPGRDEVRLPLAAGPVGQVPPALATLVVPLVREASLRHLATVRTVRTGWELLDPAGEVLAEVVDDRVRLEPSGDASRQVEVEARVADDRVLDVLDAVVATLVRAGGTETHRTKAAAALGVVEADGPVPVPAVPGGQDPAALLVRHLLARGARALLLAELDVRRGAPDAVHRLRVATRRLRSGLRTFAPLMDEAWAADLRSALRGTAAVWGMARDLEVQEARLLPEADLLPPPERERARRAVESALRERLTRAIDEASTALADPQHVTLLAALVEAAHEPRLSPPAREQIDEVVPGLVVPAMRRLRRAVDRLELDAPAEAWHRTRILAKRARYAADAVEPVLPWARRPAALLAGLTDLLGQAQDAVVGRALLAEVAEDADGSTGYALGLLAARQETVERAARAAVVATWPAIEAATRPSVLDPSG